MHSTKAYIHNIDIDIAIFCKCRIDIVSKMKSDIEASLAAAAAAAGVHRNPATLTTCCEARVGWHPVTRASRMSTINCRRRLRAWRQFPVGARKAERKGRMDRRKRSRRQQICRALRTIDASCRVRLQLHCLPDTTASAAAATVACYCAIRTASLLLELLYWTVLISREKSRGLITHT